VLKIKKRLLIEIVLSLLVLTVALFYCYSTPLQTQLQLILTLKVSHHEKDTYKVVIGKDIIESRLVGTGNFEELRFPLPMDKKIETLDIYLGLTPGLIAIKAVALRGAVVSHTIDGKKLKMLFHVYPSTAKYYFRKNNFCIKTGDILHWFRLNQSFLTLLQRLQTNKLIYYLLSFLVALLFFYLIHFIDVRMIRIFFNSRVVLSGLWLWLLFIYFPLAHSLLNITANSPAEENRQMNKKPQLRWDALPGYLEKYTHYYNDFFPCRGHFIFLQSYLKLKLLGIPATDKVLIGKKQWLFFHKNNNQPSTVDYYRNLDPFTESELRAWKEVLQARQKWLASRGIDYLFLIIPNKNTIYPEYMPDYIKKVGPYSRMDQLLDYIKKHSTIYIPDLRPSLRAAKGKYLLYYRTDTHWNDYGAFIGHQELLKYIATHYPRFKEAQPLPFSRLKMRLNDIIGGDLAIMLSLHQDVLRENNIEIFPHSQWSYTGAPLPDIAPYVTQGFTENAHAHLPHILMVHDSFYKQLKPYLSELFSRCLYIWDWGMHFFPAIIEKEKPALVIDEMAERFLLNEKIPENPKGL